MKGWLYLWLATLIISAGLMIGGDPSQEFNPEPYTPADWEEGGRMYPEDRSYPYPFEFMEQNSQEPPSLWLRQFISSVINASYLLMEWAINISESNLWVPWVPVTYTWIILQGLWTIYIIGKTVIPEMTENFIEWLIELGTQEVT